MRTGKALARLCGCAGSPEPSLVTYVISTMAQMRNAQEAQSFVNSIQETRISILNIEEGLDWGLLTSD